MEQRITRLSGNNIIEKANGLILATDKSLTCRQLKILDCYLSAINPRDSSVKTVYITKSSLENVLGCKIRYSELYKDLDTLLGSFITVKEPYGKKSFRKISLLYEYAVHMDEPTGEFIISLTCSKDLEYYIFDISKIGYTKFRLKDVAKIDGGRTLMLFEYILSKRYLKAPWHEDVCELRKILECNTGYYQDFRKFYGKILKPSINKINNNNELFFVEFEKIKDENGFVTTLEFTLSDIRSVDRIMQDENVPQVNVNASLLISELLDS